MIESVAEPVRQVIHYSFHLLVPFAIARILWKDRWLKGGAIMVAAMLIDLDHLLASPVYDPQRCSIGFHPLHSLGATIIYAALLLVPSWPVRVFSTGCLWHLCTDLVDCLLGGIWIP